MNTKVIIISIASLSVLNIGCKAINNTSQNQSLENYTAADNSKITQNKCYGPYENKEYADLEPFDGPAHLEPTLRKTLAAIPLSVREIFSTKMIGMIRLAENTTTLCSAAVKDLSEDRLDTGKLDTRSCLRSEPGQPGVELVIPATKEAIEHGLVRAYFSAVFTTMAEAEYHEQLNLFTVGKKTADLILLEQSIKQALQQDLAGQSAVNQNLFANPVDAVIEAADQYYCSPATRNVMRTEYKETYKAFTENYVAIIHETGEKTPEEIYNEIRKENVTAAAPASLSLWGRWGRGNGPLRAWGRSRIQARQAGGRGFFPNWNLARQQGYASGGVGLFPNWQLHRQNARAQLRQAGYPGVSLFPGYWANRLTR